MTKLLFMVLLCFVVGLATEDCFGEECEFGTSAAELLTITQAVPLTQYECRRAFWYYLKGANLIYQANIDTPENYLLIFIFRNVVGTFLAIGKWSKEYQVAEIATFVRLGNGYSEDVQVLYQPVRVEPFIISLKLAVGEYLIEVNEEGEFKVNGELIEVGGDDVAPYDMDARVECVDKKIRQRYWYYLDGRDPAKLLHSEPIATNKRTYVVVNYVNIVGHFLVIGSCDGDSTVIVHTFVRLGNGYPASEVEEVEPLVDLKPSVEEVNW